MVFQLGGRRRGVFNYHTKSTQFDDYESSGNHPVWEVEFDASQWNPIYQDNGGVTPPNYAMRFLIKY